MTTSWHMICIVRVGIALGVLLMSGGCGRHSSKGPMVPENIQRISSDRMAQCLQSLPHSDGNYILKKFGEPHEKITLADGTIVWKYWCTEEDHCGYQIFFEKGGENWSDVVFQGDWEETMRPGHVADPKALRRQEETQRPVVSPPTVQAPEDKRAKYDEFRRAAQSLLNEMLSLMKGIKDAKTATATQPKWDKLAERFDVIEKDLRHVKGAVPPAVRAEVEAKHKVDVDNLIMRLDQEKARLASLGPEVRVVLLRFRESSLLLK